MAGEAGYTIRKASSRRAKYATPEYEIIYKLLQEREDLKKMLGEVIEKYLNLLHGSNVKDGYGKR